VQRDVAAGCVWGLTAAVVALQIPYPLLHGRARDILTVITVVVFAAASASHAAVEHSAGTAAALLAVFGVGGFVAELVGVHTGLPFGSYVYAGDLGPAIGGVPAVIALAWVMMAWPAACVAARLTARRGSRIIIGAIALAAWDVFLDPQMVDAHHWHWRGGFAHLPGIDDVPLTNFAGWLGVAFVLMALLHAIARRGPAGRIGDNRPMLAIWVWTWLSSALADIAFFHRPAVAAWGFLSMGAVGLPLLMSIRSDRAAR
jgi:putative membrane protein